MSIDKVTVFLSAQMNKFPQYFFCSKNCNLTLTIKIFVYCAQIKEAICIFCKVCSKRHFFRYA